MASKKGSNQSGKIRYAVVGLGHIAQAAILPGFPHAKKNSLLTGLVSGDPEKLKQLGKMYGVKNLWAYKEYEDALHSGEIDAVFIALPNDMHCEFTVRAAKAGIHVLCEKPMALTTKDCKEMIDAAETNNVKLMIAYRLHIEETNLRAIEIVKSGKIGKPRYYNSIFSFQIADPNNIRLKKERGGGPVWDIGIYCINAARYLFQMEPEEVFAWRANSGDSKFKEVDETVSAQLRFPGDLVAAFTVSFASGDADVYEIVGTKGSLRVEPAFEYEGQLAYKLKIGEKEQEKTFSARDQFGAETVYFSDCVLKSKTPEPSGLEGLADVRIIQAIHESAASGKVVKLGKFPDKGRPSLEQQIKLPPSKKPKLINARPATD
jgi:predicted dehydrogenase